MSIANYLSELISQKNNLAANLVSQGVSASSSETLNTLVPKVLTISGGGGGGGDDGAFRGMVEGTLSEAFDASASFIHSSAFQNFSNLVKASFPACAEIHACAFQSCASLSEISFPACTKITASAFKDCGFLTSAVFPLCEMVTYSVFQYCYSLSQIVLPVCASIGRYAFNYCWDINEASLPSCTFIGSYAFSNCYNLMSLYLMGSTVCTIESSVFNSTPIGGYILHTYSYGSVYVPASLYSQYISAQNWSSIIARIVSV